jgi:hypothetical protein
MAKGLLQLTNKEGNCFITMDKHSNFGTGLDLMLNTYTMSHTFMTASHQCGHSATVLSKFFDDSFLEVSGWYRQIDQHLEMGYVGTRVQKIATHSIRVAMPSGFVAPMYIWNTGEEVTGLLAILAYLN